MIEQSSVMLEPERIIKVQGMISNQGNAPKISEVFEDNYSRVLNANRYSLGLQLSLSFNGITLMKELPALQEVISLIRHCHALIRKNEGIHAPNFAFLLKL